MKKVLIYVGNGDWLPGVPARDLTEEDLDHIVWNQESLLASRLYMEVPTTKKKSSPAENKAARSDE